MSIGKLLTTSALKKKTITLPKQYEVMPEFVEKITLNCQDESIIKFAKEIAGGIIERFPFF